MEEIATLIERLMHENHVPAVQVGILRGNEVAFFGSGLRDVEYSLPSNEHTSFAIGSLTKSFVSAALTLLAEEGRIHLDCPVRDYLPEFRLDEPSISDGITVRDILSHRSGVGRHEFMLQLNIDNFGAEEFLRRFRYIKTCAPIRTKMLYSNLLYMVASQIIERMSGESWSAFVRHRLTDPLEMRETNFSIQENDRAENRALPYCEKNDVIMRLPFEDIKAAGGAGAINSTTSDMLKWLRFHLDKGAVNGRTIVSAEGISQCHSPQAIISESSPLFRGELQFQSYGLGWFSECYRGHRIVHHSGGIDGFVAEMALLPELDTAFIILTNLDMNFIPGMLQFSLYDKLFGLEPVDWPQRFSDMRDTLKNRFTQQVRDLSNTKAVACPPAEALTGEYEHLGYGKIEILQSGEDLVFSARKMKIPLKPLGHQSYMLLYTEKFLLIPVRFVLDAQGAATSVEIEFESMADPISYRKLP